MANLATSIEDQLLKLQQRGMILDMEENKIKEVLLDIGYYRLGFYWHPFEIDESHNFQENTRFSNVLSLYYLDVDLRYLLIKYINRLELNFRTNLIYWTSIKYTGNSIWYADSTIVSEDYLKDIKSHYNTNFKTKNLQIKHHHVKYPEDKFAPCWKTFEYYTFGSIVKVYENLLDQDLRKHISLKYNVKKPHIFQNFLNTLVFVRNSCAHSGVIYDLHINEGVSQLPDIKFNNSNSHNLDAAIRILLYLMESISSNRKDNLKKSIEDLFNSFSENEVVKKIIEDKLGYIY